MIAIIAAAIAIPLAILALFEARSAILLARDARALKFRAILLAARASKLEKAARDYSAQFSPNSSSSND